jgi:hypothetical protein
LVSLNHFRKEANVKFWIFTTCCLASILLSICLSFAETIPKIEQAKAEAIAREIVAFDDQVARVTTNIANTSETKKLADLREELNAAQNKLDQAVNEYYVLPTNEGVRKARKLLESAALIKTLEKRVSDLTLDQTDRDTFQRSLMLAQEQSENVRTNQVEELRRDSDTRFAGFNFGIALGVTTKAGRRQIVNSASVDANGLVRIDRDDNATANFMLESHYFFTPNFPLINVAPKDWGIGPFIAVQPGTDNIIQSVGAGGMIGFKRSKLILKDLQRDRGDSFNIGFGVMLSPNAMVLGDGIEKDKPLPGDEKTIRLKRTTELAWVILFSYTF